MRALLRGLRCVRACCGGPGGRQAGMGRGMQAARIWASLLLEGLSEIRPPIIALVSSLASGSQLPHRAAAPSHPLPPLAAHPSAGRLQEPAHEWPGGVQVCCAGGADGERCSAAQGVAQVAGVRARHPLGGQYREESHRIVTLGVRINGLGQRAHGRRECRVDFQVSTSRCVRSPA